MKTTIRWTLLGLFLAAASFTATAQALRGTIEKVDGDVLSLRSSEGLETKLTLTEGAIIVAVVKASMADIKEGTFLGSAALPQPDGSQKALEVHIFPEQMRGTGEGHRPYSPVPNGTMTNGSTAGLTVAGVDGHSIVVKYQGGEKTIVVPPGVPILRYEVGGRNDLKPGARFTVFTPVRKADGTIEASRINVGRDGVAPQ